MNSNKPVIMTIDDQPVILHTIVSELRSLYTVKAFTSGQAAFKFLAEQTVDLILLDYEMPGMSGIEVLNALRANDKTAGIPVIFLTGSDDGSTEAEVLGRGAADFIQKPINARVLLTRVRLQLELNQYRNHLERLVEEKTEQLRLVNERLKQREDITLNLLAEATDMRDHATGDHIKRVTEMVIIIVTDLLNEPRGGYGLTRDEATDIIRSAKLHDLGKIAISDQILLKPGKLDSGEFKIIAQHPMYGAALFDKYISRMEGDSFLDTARDIALYHHEKWDGTGYPYGIKEHSIPLSARITALADVYDALTSVRPYKEPLTHSKSVQIITEGSSIHFDPVLVQIFLKHENEFKDITCQ